MRTKWTVNRWLGIVLLVGTVLFFTGCCARLQSPIVFDTCYGWGPGYCGYADPCSPCPPSPCSPNYSQ